MSNVGRGADVRVSIMTNDVKQKNRRKRQRRRAQKHRRSVFAISAVVLLLTVIVSVDSLTLKAKDQAYRAQEAELEEKIEEEKARAEEIKNLDEYVGTDEYIEKVAKDKLGLVYENEIVFKAK